MLTPKLLALYRRTDYTIDGRIPVTIGHRSADTDAMLNCLNARCGALITAANPRSRTMPEGWNRRMTQRLAALASATQTLPAEGRLGNWREQGLFVCGDPRRLARLGRLFRQNALVLVGQGRAARLLFLTR
jgi:hypothetical protein